MVSPATGSSDVDRIELYGMESHLSVEEIENASRCIERPFSLLKTRQLLQSQQMCERETQIEGASISSNDFRVLNDHV